MIRKHAGSGMMVGLTLLMGCAESPPKYDTNACSLPRFGAVRSPLSNADKPWAPAPAGRAAVESVKAKSPSSLPEAVGVRVSTCESAEAAQLRSVTPTPETQQKETQASAAVEEPGAGSSEKVPVPPSPEIALPTASTEAAQGVSQAAWKVPAPGTSDGELAEVVATSARCPGPDTPAGSSLKAGHGHAADYTWLTGELEHLRARNVWRLRYAPFDQEDRHGGTVVLVGDGLPADCKRGQIVHVEGQLVNPESDEPRPPYWVRSFRVLKAAPPDAAE